MPSERVAFTPRVGIPQTGGAVITPAGDDRPIRTKRYAGDPSLMPSERVDFAPRVGIPETEGVVITTGCDGIAIGTK